ncbi:MAG: hypothetical protein ACREBC_35080 [Pyrinomonadaceae bacterium]
MTETENLVLEQLRAIRGRLDRVDEKLGFMDSRLIAVEQHLAARVAMIPASNDRDPSPQRWSVCPRPRR